MKQAFYAVVTLAAVIFIGDWIFTNYIAFRQARDGAQQLTTELLADLPKQEFPYCASEWPSDQRLAGICNREQFNGLRTFQGSWVASSAATQRLAIINCFQFSKTQWGRDWAMAGGCATTN